MIPFTFWNTLVPLLAKKTTTFWPNIWSFVSSDQRTLLHNAADHLQTSICLFLNVGPGAGPVSLHSSLSGHGDVRMSYKWMYTISYLILSTPSPVPWFCAKVYLSLEVNLHHFPERCSVCTLPRFFICINLCAQRLMVPSVAAVVETGWVGWILPWCPAKRHWL